MFSKTNKANSGRDRRSSPSIIGADCTITGDILSQGEVHVDGRVDGDVRCDVLVVGATGNITGEISADLVRVLGGVTGQIKARAVELAKSARVIGDITHDSLSIEAGAFVEGRFDRMAHPATPDAKALSDRNAAGQALLSSPPTDAADAKDEKETEKTDESTPSVLANPAVAVSG